MLYKPLDSDLVSYVKQCASTRVGLGGRYYYNIIFVKFQFVSMMLSIPVISIREQMPNPVIDNSVCKTCGKEDICSATQSHACDKFLEASKEITGTKKSNTRYSSKKNKNFYF